MVVKYEIEENPQVESGCSEEKYHAACFDRAILEHALANHGSFFWGDRMLTLDKSMGFLSHPDFKAAFNAIRGTHQYDQYDSPHTIAWRLHTLVWAAQSSLRIEGDFVECGVFKGDMAWVISQLVNLPQYRKQFYLYDTFSGFSEKYSSQQDFPENPGFFAMAQQCYSEETLYQKVSSRFSQREDIRVIQGVVPDILLEIAPERIAFLHIDLNSPAAEVGALEILFPRLSSGAAVVLDDYGWKLFHKQKEAEDAFFLKQGYEVLELPTGQGLVIKK